MIFVIDVGNTNVATGIFQGEELTHKWRMTTDANKTSDEIGLFFMNCFNTAGINIEDIEAVVIASVVPTIMYSLEHAIRKYMGKEALVVGPGIKTGIKLRNENPKEVGADRIVNAVAACKKYKGPKIIVDFGTATTFDAITENDEYLGGVICPGIKISADALFSRTAKLPRVELAKPQTVIGKNSISSMQSGLFYGYVGQVMYIVNKMKKEFAEDALVIATGGLARAIASSTKSINIVDGTLTLEGLRIIYERNK